MLSDEVLDNIQILKFFHDKCTSEKSIGMMQVYRVDELAKAIETILNFIEKQQKEIKNLVDENNDLHKEINRRIKLKIENEKIVDNEFISKNKIREKIKRLDYSRDNTEQRYFKKEVLQELLNENHIPHVD